MKTVASSPPDFNGDGDDDAFESPDRSRWAENGFDHFPGQDVSDPPPSESDNLIICDSQLASSFQEVKIAKSRLNPGHYLQKVFLPKLRSQSAPSLDKQKDKKCNGRRESPAPLSDDIQSSPRKDSAVAEPSRDNDNWYKTWPECGGVEKSTVAISKNGVVNKENGNVNGAYPPERGPCSKCNSTVCDKRACPIPNTPISLDNILHTLPIAYSPVTKQIHLVRTRVSAPEAPSIVKDSQDPGCPASKPDEDGPGNKLNNEGSSFSSTFSSLSDNSPSNNEDSALGSLLENSDNCSVVSIGNCSVASEESYSLKNKRRGISGIFSRNVFNWKGRNESTSDGWRIFGRGNESELGRATSSLSLDNYQEDMRSIDSDRGVLGSTGLIQLDRPAWLPAKPKQEKESHDSQHVKILLSAKKREMKESKLRKKNLQNQYKFEDELANTIKVWVNDILPKWHQVKNQKRTLDLWWQGIPPCVRGKVWRMAIRNDLNITHELYDICVARAEERLKSARGSTDSVCDGMGDCDREASMELIQLDISRTFPNLCIFQKGGPYYDMLHSLLAAYVCYRPDVGYVQGMSFIAAVLILNMDAPDAFVCFANLLNRPCHRAFYSLDQQLMEAYYSTYKILLNENLPKLSDHIEKANLTPDLYLLDWVYTVFAKAMNLDLASRVWDVFLRDGEEFLFRTAIGVLKLSQDCLMGMDFLTGSKYLTRLPDDITPCQLFKSIASVRMVSNKSNFSQILQSQCSPSSL